MDLPVAISKIPHSAFWLGVVGLVPFWLALMPVFGHGGGLVVERGLQIQVGYGALVLSFLGGVRWGAALKLPRGPLQSTLFVFSVLPSLAAFAALLLPTTVGLVLLIAAYLLHGAWDVQAAQRRQLQPWYATLRALLTAGAVLALLISLVMRLAAS